MTTEYSCKNVVMTAYGYMNMLTGVATSVNPLHDGLVRWLIMYHLYRGVQ